MHLLSVGPDEDHPVWERYKIIRTELERFDSNLALREEVVALTKIDLISNEELQSIRSTFKEHFPNVQVLEISAAQRVGLKDLKYMLWQRLGQS